MRPTSVLFTRGVVVSPIDHNQAILALPRVHARDARGYTVPARAYAAQSPTLLISDTCLRLCYGMRVHSTSADRHLYRGAFSEPADQR